ncbi:hypothetical protein CU100_06915 [Phyllobacterium endophyticum]|uniref:Uncharacterized protein n=1 Tax=Phyllobacterium endophyticum TaxID=1149773 RepID=A0A2P7B1U1_9HYPH|nr:hypothetical protein CU100_06915 [Phyllobacterium endophyticum]
MNGQADDLPISFGSRFCLQAFVLQQGRRTPRQSYNVESIFFTDARIERLRTKLPVLLSGQICRRTLSTTATFKSPAEG